MSRKLPERLPDVEYAASIRRIGLISYAADCIAYDGHGDRSLLA